MRWKGTSKYSIAQVDGPYAVSKAIVLDTATGELVDAYVAWCGTQPLSRHLGEEGARRAKEACQAHAETSKGRPGAVNTGTAITQHAEMERSA